MATVKVSPELFDIFDQKQIQMMIKRGRQEGLLPEVLMSYTRYIKNGESIGMAVNAALRDRDC